MAGNIVNALAHIQTLAASLSGVRKAPTHPPDQMHVFPFAVSYIGQVETTKPSATLTIGVYTIVTEIHVSRRDLPRDYDRVDDYFFAFPAAVWADPKLAGTVDTTLTCNGVLAPLAWGGVETLAVQFQTRVKVT